MIIYSVKYFWFNCQTFLIGNFISNFWIFNFKTELEWKEKKLYSSPLIIYIFIFFPLVQHKNLINILKGNSYIYLYILLNPFKIWFLLFIYSLAEDGWRKEMAIENDFSGNVSQLYREGEEKILFLIYSLQNPYKEIFIFWFLVSSLLCNKGNRKMWRPGFLKKYLLTKCDCLEDLD